MVMDQRIVKRSIECQQGAVLWSTAFHPQRAATRQRHRELRPDHTGRRFMLDYRSFRGDASRYPLIGIFTKTSMATPQAHSDGRIMRGLHCATGVLPPKGE